MVGGGDGDSSIIWWRDAHGMTINTHAPKVRD